MSKSAHTGKPVQRSWRMTYRRTLRPMLMVYGLLLVVLVAAELLLGVTRPDLRDPTYFQVPGLSWDKYDNYTEDPVFFWKPRIYYPGMEDRIRQAISPNRIYVFGGSIANGLADPLADYLKEKGPASDVFNLACGGWTSYQSIHQQEKFFAVRPPTHAVMTNAYNDVQLAISDYRTQAKRNKRWGKHLLYTMNQSRVFTLFRRHLHAVPATDRNPKPVISCVPLDHYRENLEAFTRSCKAAGTHPVLVTQGFPIHNTAEEVAPYFKVMKEVADREGAIFVDVRDAISEAGKRFGIPDAGSYREEFEKRRHLLWTDDIHPNETGYRIISEKIAEEVAVAGAWNR